MEVVDPIDAVSASKKSFVKADIRVFVNRFSSMLPPGQKFTGKAIAKVFHGLVSPVFTAMEWSRNTFWGRYKDVDFLELSKIATEELISAKK